MNTASFLALALPLAAPQLKERPAVHPLVGRWECTDLCVDGKPDPQWAGLEYEFTAAGGWVIYRNGQVLDDLIRAYRLDPKAGPEAMEFHEGRPNPAAFRVEKDTLKVASQTESAERPAGPEARGRGIMTFTFRRVAKGK